MSIIFISVFFTYSIFWQLNFPIEELHSGINVTYVIVMSLMYFPVMFKFEVSRGEFFNESYVGVLGWWICGLCIFLFVSENLQPSSSFVIYQLFPFYLDVDHVTSMPFCPVYFHLIFWFVSGVSSSSLILSLRLFNLIFEYSLRS